MSLLALLLVVLFGPGAVNAQAQLNCDSSQSADTNTLVRELEDFERGLRELRLPKDRFDDLLQRGKKAILENHYLLRKVDEECERRRR